jgi:hypothetical protein
MWVLLTHILFLELPYQMKNCKATIICPWANCLIRSFFHKFITSSMYCSSTILPHCCTAMFICLVFKGKIDFLAWLWILANRLSDLQNVLMHLFWFMNWRYYFSKVTCILFCEGQTCCTKGLVFNRYACDLHLNYYISYWNICTCRYCYIILSV